MLLLQHMLHSLTKPQIPLRLQACQRGARLVLLEQLAVGGDGLGVAPHAVVQLRLQLQPRHAALLRHRRQRRQRVGKARAPVQAVRLATSDAVSLTALCYIF